MSISVTGWAAGTTSHQMPSASRKRFEALERAHARGSAGAAWTSKKASLAGLVMGAASGAVLGLGKPTVVFAQPYSGHEWVGFGALQREELGAKLECLLTSDFSQLAVAIRPFRAIHHLREAKILNLTTRPFETHLPPASKKTSPATCVPRSTPTPTGRRTTCSAPRKTGVPATDMAVEAAMVRGWAVRAAGAAAIAGVNNDLARGWMAARAKKYIGRKQ